MARVESDIVVDAPLRAVYNQWTQFEDFPLFMGAVEKVTQLGDDRLEWVAEMGGVRRQWVAKILEQVPDWKVAWAAVEGVANDADPRVKHAAEWALGQRGRVSGTQKADPKGASGTQPAKAEES